MATTIPRLIECLACGAVRRVVGFRIEHTGECARCGYVGWTYADRVDGATEQMIMNGHFARGAARRHLAASAASRSDLGCRWRQLRALRTGLS